MARDYLSAMKFFFFGVRAASGTRSCTFLPDETAYLSLNKSIPSAILDFVCMYVKTK